MTARTPTASATRSVTLTLSATETMILSAALSFAHDELREAHTAQKRVLANIRGKAKAALLAADCAPEHL